MRRSYVTLLVMLQAQTNRPAPPPLHLHVSPNLCLSLHPSLCDVLEYPSTYLLTFLSVCLCESPFVCLVALFVDLPLRPSLNSLLYFFWLSVHLFSPSLTSDTARITELVRLGRDILM